MEVQIAGSTIGWKLPDWKLNVLRIQGMIARMEKEAADSETKFQYLGTGKCW